METFKFIKDKYTNEKVVADSGVIKAVLSNGTDVTNSVNDETFQTAALASDNISGKEVKVYTLRESLSNINPTGEVTNNNTVKILSLGVTNSPSGVVLPKAAAAALSKTPATAELPNGITWNNSSGDNTTNVNVNVDKATIGKIAKFTISGTVTVKKFVKASGNLNGTNVYTKGTLASGGSTGTGYYDNGKKCVAIEKYTTKEKVIKKPSTLTGGPYYNLVVNSQSNWKLGIDRNENIGETSSGSVLQDSFNINDVSFDTNMKDVKVSAWQKTAGTSYKKISEVTVVCDPTVYYRGYHLPSGNCFDKDGTKLDSNSNLNLNNIDIVYKEKCDVVSDGIPYKYDSNDTDTYSTYASEERVQSSSENCNISNNTLTPNQTPFTKVGDENSIYLNAKVDGVRKTVEFQ